MHLLDPLLGPTSQMATRGSIGADALWRVDHDANVLA